MQKPTKHLNWTVLNDANIIDKSLEYNGNAPVTVLESWTSIPFIRGILHSLLKQ